MIAAEDLATHLKRKLAPLYTVFGDEPLLVIEAADCIPCLPADSDCTGNRIIEYLVDGSWLVPCPCGTAQHTFRSLLVQHDSAVVRYY